MKKKANGNVSATKFIKAWKAGGTVVDVARRCGLKVSSVRVRAVKWRAKGIKLPKLTPLPMGKPPLDVKALNALLKGKK